MIEKPFVFPEALALADLQEAEHYVHDDCPYCESEIELARQYPKEWVLVNLESQDVLGVFISARKSISSRSPEPEREEDGMTAPLKWSPGQRPVCIGHVHVFEADWYEPNHPPEIHMRLVHDKHCPEWCR